MNKWAKLLLAVAAASVIAPQMVLADHDWGRNRGNWGNRYYGNNGNYGRRYYGNNYNYLPPNYVRTWNGSYVDGTIGPDGQPAWAGGYRPWQHR